MTALLFVLFVFAVAVAVALYRDLRWWKKHCEDASDGWARAIRMWEEDAAAYRNLLERVRREQKEPWQQ